jgi:serine/threonine protein kinase
VAPRKVGPYEVLGVIGRGGIGTVYRARDPRTGAALALKLLGPSPAVDPMAARRLAREFEALADLDHPNVLRVLEAGVAEGYSFLAMELVEGLDLRSYMSPLLDENVPRSALRDPADAERAGAPISDPSSGGFASPHEMARAPGGAQAIRAFAAMMEEPETEPRSVDACWTRCETGEPTSREAPPDLRPLTRELQDAFNRPQRIRRLRLALAQVCDGLAYIHRNGLIHRDLKPSNIMVDDDRRVRIMDFGLVKLTDDPSLTLSRRVVGTYRYMAPEQARGDPVDPRADLYSLGVILFELVCGRPPFSARRPCDMWEEILSRPAPPMRSVNPAADPVLARMAERLLAKDPADRYPSAEAVLRALEAPGD